MGRKSTVSQKEVDDICEELRLQNLEINSHSIRKRLGRGSYDKIYVLMLNWQERCLPADENTTLSDLELINPLVAALKIMKKNLGDRYESEAIKQLEEENEELQEKVMNYEKTVISLESRIKTLEESIQTVVKQTVDKTNQERDKEFKAMEERLEHLEKLRKLVPEN